MTTELEEVVGEAIILTVPCNICGRKFLPERLEKHVSVCSKTKESQKKRKQFDSSKQRAEIEGLPNGLAVLYPKASSTTTAQHQKAAATQSASSKKSNWREKHEEFLRTVKAARGEKVDEDDETGGNTKPRIPVGYIECDCCGRNFSEKAADRHIAWCKEQKARIPRSANNAVAMERMKARIKYKPNKIKAITPPSTKSSSTNSTPQRTNTRVIKASPQKSPVMSNNSSPKSVTKIQYKSPRSLVAKKISPPKSDRKRIISLAKPKYMSQYDLDALKKLPKESIMKFKEKFPNHQCRNDSNDEHLVELMKKSPEEYSHCGPRTVPGVRTGGMSPVGTIKSTNHSSLGYNIKKSLFNDSEEDELTKLKARIEEMYISTASKIKPTNGMISAISADALNTVKKPNEINSVETSTTRGSSSDSCNSSIRDQSRDGSSDGVRSQGSIMSNSDIGSAPKLCHQCTTKYATVKAKYCYECGARRLGSFGPPFFN